MPANDDSWLIPKMLVTDADIALSLADIATIKTLKWSSG
jgi:hypothetical protein